MRGWTETMKKVVHGDATTPTVSTESVVITSKIDAYEGRDVKIYNRPVAFKSADMDEVMRMALHGRLAELMVNIATQIYRQHVIYEKGKKVLYFTLKKDLYDCLTSTFLLYEWLVAYMRGKELNSTPKTHMWRMKLLESSN